MPYKIYTYEDPYKLDQADYWQEIAALPHFCVSRTLVNGMKANIQNSISGLICPLDDLVSHQEVYYAWTNNVGLKIRQHSELTKLFRSFYQSGQINQAFFLSLQQNESRFLDAIRLFIELGIPASVLDQSKGNPEQQLFVQALSKLENNPSFMFPATIGLPELKSIMVQLAEKELEDYRGNSAPERSWYQRAIQTTKEQSLSAVVIHGVHQFSPSQLRLIIEMEKMGLTIIFLYNYQKKYPTLYSSWAKIYTHFNVPIHHDKVVPEYIIPVMQNESNALACAIGEICEGRYSPGNSSFQRWYQLYQSIQLIEFENITEYAHFVSSHVHAAERILRRKQGVVARGNDVAFSNAQILSAMTEQVYTANRDVHSLLKIYHPEFAKDRHFLAYPIGQFFSAIYKLWNYERQEIDIDITALKECLSSNVLKSGSGEVLLRTFYNVEILFRNIKTFSDFRIKFVHDYLGNRIKVKSAKSSEAIFALRNLAIYSDVKAKPNDVKALANAIEELNSIARELFLPDRTKKEFIDFGQHFEKLESFLQRRELLFANAEEKALIDALCARLERIAPERTTFSGTFRDLQQGIHYYLKQKEDGESVDWIVKNFEQIDGDVLNSKPQFEKEINKTYHFACLSDRDLNQGLGDLLPWPLTEQFIQEAYDPVDLQFQVYWTALDERNNFLRYALFYGLYYNRCGVRLSYVKQYDDEITEPFVLLSILGLKPEYVAVDSANRGVDYSINIPSMRVSNVKCDWIQMMDMFLCPYRYLLEYVAQNGPVIQGEFLTQKFYEAKLIESSWKRIENKPRSAALQYYHRIVEDESKKIAPYFGFWSGTEIFDLNRRAANYLYGQVIKNYPTTKRYKADVVKARYAFGKATFQVSISDSEPQNPYPHFESLSDKQFPNKRYSYFPVVQAQNSSELKDEIKEYLNNTSAKENIAIPSEWCVYCPQKGICVEPFQYDN